MSLEVAVTPAGDLALCQTVSAEEVAPQDSAALHAAFASSSAAGLLQLARDPHSQLLQPTLAFWREFAQRFFHAVSQLGEQFPRRWDAVLPPQLTDLEEIIANSPPMRGHEYLTPHVLQQLWLGFCRAAQEDFNASGDEPAVYLRRVAPLSHLIGRVTFHLAENKRDARRPFAFLATYTRGITRGTKLQHLPLAQALRESVAANDQDRLTALLEPVRRAASASALVSELLESKSLFQPQAWEIGQAYRFLKDAGRMEEAGVVVRLPDWWRVRRPPRPQVQVRLGEASVSSVGLDGLMDFQVSLALDGEPLSDQERRQILQATEGLILLRGKWVEVNQDRLQQALSHWELVQKSNPDGVTFTQGMRMLAGAPVDTGDGGECAVDWSDVVAGDWLAETLRTLRDPAGITTVQPGLDLQATLRPYQSAGVRWLWFMTKLGLGACLADDMGLGKTIQVIDLLLQFRRESAASGQRPARRRLKSASKTEPPERTAPSLLIVPSSLIGNWKQELKRFGPSLRVQLLHRSECDRETLDQIARQPLKSLANVDLVVTTYGLVRLSNWLREVNWRLVILDEAQAIKNAGAAQTRAVKRLPAQGRLVLTGTPVENHLGDLWSLFDFCNPGLLGTANQFRQYVKHLNQQKDAGSFGVLRRLVRPYILRRLKTDPGIVPDLPDKTEMRVECGLERKQAALYERAVADLAERLKSADGIARRGLVLATLMQLKQICNHPSQYLGESTFTAAESGKFQRLNLICDPIVERQERMLVFTQFQSICDPLADCLAGLFGRRGLVLHGKTPVKQRSELVRQFQADGGPPFLVISVKAGGSGLNLTAASHVVHFDRWWNPAVENQATDRAFRIGQKRNVLVHKFVCRGTVEERIDQMITAKRDLADKLLDQSGEAILTEMSDAELLDFVAIDLERARADD